MGRKDSARGPFAERCFLVGPFRSAASADAPLYKEAFSSSLVQMDVGLSALQLRFLVTSCLAGACVADLVAGWRVLARLSNILTLALSAALLGSELKERSDAPIAKQNGAAAYQAMHHLSLLLDYIPLQLCAITWINFRK